MGGIKATNPDADAFTREQIMKARAELPDVPRAVPHSSSANQGEGE